MPVRHSAKRMGWVCRDFRAQPGVWSWWSGISLTRWEPTSMCLIDCVVDRLRRVKLWWQEGLRFRQPYIRVGVRRRPHKLSVWAYKSRHCGVQ